MSYLFNIDFSEDIQLRFIQEKGKSRFCEGRLPRGGMFLSDEVVKFSKAGSILNFEGKDLAEIIAV